MEKYGDDNQNVNTAPFYSLGIKKLRMFGASDFAKAQPVSLPVKETSSTLMCVSSLDRYASLDDARSNPTSSGRFTIKRPNASMLNGHFTSLALTELRLHWTHPNVSLRFGTASIILETSDANTAANVQSYTLLLDEGFYTPAELAAVLQQVALSVVPPLDLVCAYDASMCRFNFSCDPTAGLFFRFMPDPDAFTNNVPYQVATPGMQGRAALRYDESDDYSTRAWGGSILPQRAQRGAINALDGVRGYHVQAAHSEPAHG
jgi:hypothetical protein